VIYFTWKPGDTPPPSPGFFIFSILAQDFQASATLNINLHLADPSCNKIESDRIET
jgi:hypothetical protein